MVSRLKQENFMELLGYCVDSIKKARPLNWFRYKAWDRSALETKCRLGTWQAYHDRYSRWWCWHEQIWYVADAFGDSTAFGDSSGRLCKSVDDAC